MCLLGKQKALSGGKPPDGTVMTRMRRRREQCIQAPYDNSCQG